MKSKSLARVLAVVMVAVLLMFVFSGCSMFGAPTETEEGSGSGQIIQTIAMFAVLIAVFYFAMIRPESKKKKKAAEMRNSLEAGDKITTIGGMVGKIVSVSGDFITFETSEDRVRIEVAKWAIQTIGKQTEEPPK